MVRNATSLNEALRAIDDIAVQGEQDPLIANMVLTAKLIATAALQRKESRGGHFRSDYPDPDPALAVRTFITLDELNSRLPAARAEDLSSLATAGSTP